MRYGVINYYIDNYLGIAISGFTDFARFAFTCYQVKGLSLILTEYTDSSILIGVRHDF